MTTNETVVFRGPESVAIEDRSVPDPGPGEVLVETDCTLISTGTELTILSGDYPDGSVWDRYGDYPFVPGYNNVGTVVDSGDGVDGPAPGTRVATWSPHQRYVTAAADDCLPVPGGVSDRDATLFSIAQIVLNGLRRGRVTFGESLAVFGLGLLGQFTTRLAHVAGAGSVFALDVAPDRHDFLPGHPEVVPLNPATDDDWVDTVTARTDGRLADAVFEVTGSPDAIPDQLAVLRDQGRFVILSSPRGETTFDFHDMCNAPSYEIIGAHQTSHPTVETPQTPWTKHRNAGFYFDLLRSGRVDVGGLYTHRRAAADAPELYHSLLEDRTRAMAVCLEW
jgi:2-desacetyl-2-hydroxyethyl bacteriochlorophyllide A dehydrogenase